jgi:hypothetical protein
MKEEQEYVDGYELHALGWLFWLNFLALQGEGGREIADHRADLFGKELEARSRIDPIHNMVASRRVRFTGDVVTSVKKLLQLMMQLYPDRFGHAVLLSRRRYFGIATLLCFVSCFVFGEFLFVEFLWKGSIVMTFLLLGFMNFFPLAILFQVTGMLKRLKFKTE